MQDAIQEEENRPELLARGKGVPVTVGLKEARGKVPSQRTETAYKAVPADKSSESDEIQSQAGNVYAVATWDER